MTYTFLESVSVLSFLLELILLSVNMKATIKDAEMIGIVWLTTND